MSTYKGPHVEVTQNFETSAPSVAIENLPSNAIGTAYDVYKKEVLDSVLGITPKQVLWGVDNVLFDESVSGKRAYDFYPADIYADTFFGDTLLSDILKDADGATIDVDETFDVPNTEKELSGFLPYYKKISGVSGDVTILSSDLSSVNIDNGAVVSNRIRVGQKVFVTTNSGSSWVYVGVVGSLTSSEGKIKLASPYSAQILTGNGIVVGAASTTLEDYVDILFDQNADFITNKVKAGDIVEFSSASIPGSEATPIEATVVSIINKNTIRFNTDALATGQIDYDLMKYKASVTEISSTVDLLTYKIKRLLGFSQNYGLKFIEESEIASSSPSKSESASSSKSESPSLSGSFSSSPSGSKSESKSESASSSKSESASTSPEIPVTGVRVEKLSAVKFSYHTAGNPVLSVGDQFAITSENPDDNDDERDMEHLRLYTVKNIVLNGSVYEVTTDESIFMSVGSSEVAFSNYNFLTAWNPKITSDIKADFRNIRSEEKGVAKRFDSVDSIVAAYSKDSSIDIHNELAFMLQVMFNKSGGKVVYGVHVSSKASDRLTEYGDAIEELKVLDIYSTCLGTTDAGINAIIGDYVDEQADPYEAHERIAVLCYDDEDIYNMGSDVASVSITGVLTITGTFNPITAGLTTGDKVVITTSGGVLVGTYNIVSTPDHATPTTINTDYADGVLTGADVVFMCGRKDAQAVRIGAIKYGNRRIKVLWPGYFIADFGGETYTLPPYYLAAARCGMDGGVVVSQSCTNYSFSIPGLSNIQLNTNFYFRKEQLDEIGGGGVDILIQDTSSSQTIKSRHDLTSNMDAIEYREWSITKQADVAAKTYRTSVSPYIGKYNITKELIQFLSSVVGISSAVLIKNTIVSNAETISIARDTLVVDKINMVITITVFVANNYIDITLNVKSK
jgi:hypothetical protein